MTSATNPYHDLFDDPDALNAHEHTGECNSGMGIPWGAPSPGMHEGLGMRKGLGTDERVDLRRPKGWWKNDDES